MLVWNLTSFSAEYGRSGVAGDLLAGPRDSRSDSSSDQNRSLPSVLLLLGVIALLIAGAGLAEGSVAGGRHDLSLNIGGSNWEFATTQVCVFCHTPHGANNSLDGLLWNRSVRTGSFRPYANNIANTLDSTPGQPGTVSLLCLSCHDGLIGMNSMFNPPNDTLDFDSDGYPDPLGVNSAFGDAGDPITNLLNIGCAGGCGSDGLELRDDHPIGFSYDAAYNAEVASGANGLIDPLTIPEEIRFFGPSSDQVECSTCHDPHLTNSGATSNAFVVYTMDGSGLCLECHNK